MSELTSVRKHATKLSFFGVNHPFISKFSQNKRTGLIIGKCCSCPLGSHMIWKSSIYKFVIPVKNKKYKEIFIDVTRSAPPMKNTGKELQDTFDWALSQIK
ncbi:MAG TPA: hypothetical protein VD699_06670 [Nitrosopumilaceae archaeon]|nr:hypothetical protein [Nitrosopumilaceae archaeon]